jgi:hypothetical protein
VQTEFNKKLPQTVTLQLYVLDASPPFSPRRIVLNDGVTFRFAADGWGLVQLYLGAVTSTGLEDSHTNHNTQKRAETWAPTLKDMGSVDAWDFKQITAFSSKLNRQIKKFSVGKLNSRAVLPGALSLWQNGVSLLPYDKNTASLEMK